MTKSAEAKAKVAEEKTKQVQAEQEVELARLKFRTEELQRQPNFNTLLPQILAHRDPNRLLAISTPRRDQLPVPIDLLLSCRADDALLLPQIAQWCREGGEACGVRNCVLLLTPGSAASELQPPPFPAAQVGDAAEAESLLQGLANVQILRSRLSADVVSEAFARMAQPCRVVVSGPAEFNAAARALLAELADVEEQVTILQA